MSKRPGNSGLFKNRPPAASRVEDSATSDNPDDSYDPFNRSKLTMARIADEDRESAKKKEKKQKNRLKQSEADDATSSRASTVKRRRLSQDKKNPASDTDSDAPLTPRKPKLNPQASSELSTPKSKLKASSPALPKQGGVPVLDTVTIDSSDDEGITITPSRKPYTYVATNESPGQVKSSPGRNTYPDGSEFTPRPAQQPSGKDGSSTSEPPEIISSTLPILSPATKEPPTDDYGPVLNILVWSDIPDTHPVLVKRRLNQRLREVRVGWCDKQRFSNEQTTKVFLIWRGRKIFDFTTFKSLGVTVDENGDPQVRGASGGSGTGLEKGQLAVEALTMELWEEKQKQKKAEEDEMKRKKQSALELPPEPPATNEQEDKPRAQTIKVILKAKGLEEYKVQVKPSTKFKQMVTAFRKMRNIDPNSKITLMFDGEELAEETEMQQSEVEDMDYIDVHIKVDS